MAQAYRDGSEPATTTRFPYHCRMSLISIHRAQLEVRQIEAASDAPRRTPIVFLHEGLGSVAMWRDWPQQVCAATGRAGVVYSRRGYGQSDPVPDVRSAPGERDGLRVGRLRPDYMHLEAWEVLPELLRALQIDKPLLLGHSDGASIALLYASRHLVEGCIVLDPAFRRFDIRGDCQRISAPLLAIQGIDDAYGTLQQIEQIRPSGGQITLQKLAQCGHSPHRDQTALTTQLIVDFLAPME